MFLPPPEVGFDEGDEAEFFFFGHGGRIGFFHGAVGEGDVVCGAAADGFAEDVGEGFGDVYVGVQVVEVDVEFPAL